MHVVSTAIEMPEGVALSDGEDGKAMDDMNDPHRALDINLDEPVEVRAVPKRPPPVLKTTTKVESSSAGLVEMKTSTKGQKKKKKSKDVDVEEGGNIKSKSAKVKKNKERGLVDLDDVEEKSGPSKVDKPVKKDKKKRKDKEGEGPVAVSKEKSNQLLGYEEAIGISTPSKEFA